MRGHHPWLYVKAFYWKAYEDNLTGLSGMVAYTMLLSLLPLALLALFIGGRVLPSTGGEGRGVRDLPRLFPGAAAHTITSTPHKGKKTSTSFRVVAWSR